MYGYRLPDRVMKKEGSLSSQRWLLAHPSTALICYPGYRWRQLLYNSCRLPWFRDFYTFLYQWRHKETKPVFPAHWLHAKHHTSAIPERVAKSGRNRDWMWCNKDLHVPVVPPELLLCNRWRKLRLFQPKVFCSYLFYRVEAALMHTMPYWRLSCKKLPSVSGWRLNCSIRWPVLPYVLPVIRKHVLRCIWKPVPAYHNRPYYAHRFPKVFQFQSSVSSN